MKRKLLKPIALFLAINFLANTLAPTISYALTAGPSAPEYTSFEPVDTTDMVNLSTGDFTYNIPLLNVPGPEGGYPLSLSYHAGIGPEEEASWVGLGWTLNPGALNRSVNGYPDDASRAVRSVHDYWSGGETNIFTVGVGYAMYSMDVDIAHDTYKGTGIGLSTSAGYGESFGPFKLGVSGGISMGPYGGYSVGINASAGVRLGSEEGGGALSLSTGLSTNFESLDVSNGVGVDVHNASIVGASISSSDLKPSVHLGGIAASAVNNSSAGRISSSENNFRATIPLPYGFSVTYGQRYMRYWSDERNSIETYGSLYLGNTLNDPSTSAIDSYAIPQFEESSYSNADKQKGGSFPAYDMYSVLGQGIGGIIQPYAFQNTYLYRQNVTDNSENQNKNVLKFGVSDQSLTKPLNFRFKNDFSNSFKINQGGFPTVPVNSYTNAVPLMTVPTATTQYNSNYYNSNNNMLAGSKHIEYVTNLDIHTGNFMKKSSFLPHEGGLYVNREVDVYGSNVSNQIGGFIVTNGSGVSYHYSLPVYAYGEYSKVESKSDGGHYYKETTNNQAYAYTWLLTAITGPDFVDRGVVGISDDDLGYWVKFNYGKWTDSFKWRTPLTDKKKDIEDQFEVYAGGSKELYYLDYIRTRTHTAVFEKEIRKDGKGVSSIEQGGILPFHGERLESSQWTFTSGSEYEQFLSVSPMRLKNIYLFENNDLAVRLDQASVSSLENLKQKGGGPYTALNLSATFHKVAGVGSNNPDDHCTQIYSGDPSVIQIECTANRSKVIPISHLWGNVLDQFDIESITNFNKSSLRVISFDHSYDLAGQTPTSVSDNDQYYSLNTSTIAQGGKLTLKSVNCKGKGGVSIMPSTVFHYNYSEPDGSYKTIATDAAHNPAYSKNKRDIWGNYKSDLVDESMLDINEDFARSVSDASALNVHAWSLKEIETGIGAKMRVDYESDTYNNIVLTPKNSLVVKSIVEQTGSAVQVDFYEGITNLNSIFKVGDNVSIAGTFKYESLNSAVQGYACLDNNGDLINKYIGWLSFNSSLKITSVGTSSITVVPATTNASDDIQAFINQFNYSSTQILDCPCAYEDNGSVGVNGRYYFRGKKGEFKGGTLFYDVSTVEHKGGGLKVSKISLLTADRIYSTHYSYLNGATSYEPIGYRSNFLWEIFDSKLDIIWTNQRRGYQVYRMNLAAEYNNILSYARELPGPGVMYGTVQVKESLSDADGTNTKFKPGWKEFEFETFYMDDSHARADVDKSSSLSGARNNEVTYKDFTSRIGNLRRVTDYNTTNSKIEETTYGYLHDDIDPLTPETRLSNQAYSDLLDNNYSSQGHIEELFHELRYTGEFHSEIFLYTKRVEYPSVLKSVTTKNYLKTGVSTKSENLAFDFITGVPTKIVTSDAYGNRFITETIPTYTLDAYKNGMGIKIFNDYLTNSRLSKHMLSQTAKTIVYKADGSNNSIGLVSANVQTWNGYNYDNTFDTGNHTEQTEVWRPNRIYAWIGDPISLQADGLHDCTTYNSDVFNFWGQNQEPGNTSFWQKNAEITLYDPYSHVLEEKDLMGNYSASRRDHRNKEIIASASLSKYDEFTYSGGEYFEGNTELDNGVDRGQGIPANSFAHTGIYSLKVDPDKKGFIYTLDKDKVDLSKKYWASVWVYMPGYSQSSLSDAKLYYKINGVEVSASPVITHQAGSKFLITLRITPNGSNNIEIGCKNTTSSGRSIYFDDFRVHPLGASVKSYVYDQSTGQILAILNNDNLYTRYVYNDAGKLTKTYQELFQVAEKKVSSTRYNYGKNF
jgi:hypothetical protein